MLWKGFRFFYTSLSGAMQRRRLLDSGVDFTYRLFTSDYTEKRPSLHTGACHCQGFKEPQRLHPQWSCEKASVPRNQICSKCCDTIFTSSGLHHSQQVTPRSLYLLNLLWNCSQTHKHAGKVCVSHLLWCKTQSRGNVVSLLCSWAEISDFVFAPSVSDARGLNFAICIYWYVDMMHGPEDSDFTCNTTWIRSPQL